ncbi:MAG TPA: tRNA-dihydrouridine synthase family protein [Fimbriimonadaceae bacterium]|nr:tRNA-dihydrouridine synthase family protein [Fimbriimonadaceae bacterium]
MVEPDLPALVLAPMEGITDAPMRALLGGLGAFTFAVSEFLRVSQESIPAKVFLRDIPELRMGGRTPTGLPVQIQILGGHPERMALSAVTACEAGAEAIDINFGCPAPTVNRHDGGASLLNHPSRIRDIVAAVRAAVPAEIPVSAKLRLGWDCIDAVDENCAMAAEGGASWLTIHARTRTQGYMPPVYWEPIGRVRRALGLPVVANGDIWTLDDFRRCRDETGCIHFMLGRCALADPILPRRIAVELGIAEGGGEAEADWPALLHGLAHYTECYEGKVGKHTVQRFKQWLKIATKHGRFPYFDVLKHAETVDDFFASLRLAMRAA